MTLPIDEVLRPLLVRLLYATTLALATGCGSHAKSDALEPIPECQEYERAFARCTGRDASIASQSAALATSKAERTRIAALCVTNIQRIKEACP